MPNAHPLFVHFPIALLSIGFFADLFGFLLKRDSLKASGWFVQLLGSIALLPTILTGLLAEAGVSIMGASQETFDAHEQSAFAAATVLLSLALWRAAGRGRPGRPTALFLSLYAVGIGLLWMAAWYGGELVFQHGIGVQK
jgi:uncharacterized membrane protein